ncbi:unnamed protein product [Adineta steineri]|uniref:Uncharacterized protein n=1 Tax=Adineta steineri TaxID=433720 RepID=A0A814Q0G1_9BILA|nr:unnamed protein product [Adineta steineri]CAF0995383.1 unnamed protein product [Adineta steineri]CAF1113557.1 unnamed protein product [Adineta steineri]CAF1113919.1 unnamed protein product [Adineta steineri]
MVKSRTVLIALAILLTLLVFVPNDTEAISYCARRCLERGYPRGIQRGARCFCSHKIERGKRDATSAALVDILELGDPQ